MVTMGGFKFAVASQSYDEYVYSCIHVCGMWWSLFNFYESSDFI